MKWELNKMPARSRRQYRYMAAIAHGADYGAAGPSQKVAEEFIHKTPKKLRKKWSKTLNKKK